jgi:hypothetical protein
MIITKMALPRRTFLRGIGATLALPFLDAMVPALSALAKTAGTPAMRLGFFYVANGVTMDAWHPRGEGTSFEISPILTPLAPFRDQMIVVKGLANIAAEGTTGVHSRCHTAWLNGTTPKKTEGADIQAGTTIDQHAARKLGQDTLLDSLEMCLEPRGFVGACDNGYSCAYGNTFSWRTPTTPMPMEDNPRVVFERLFGAAGSPAQRAAQIRTDRSILDAVTADIAQLQRTLGPADRATVGGYLDAVRQVETRLQKAERVRDVTIERPIGGIPDSDDEHARLMLDLQFLAYQADITRVSSLQISRESSSRTYPQIGVPNAHHEVSHHQNRPERLALNAKINTYQCSLFAHLVEKMRSTPDGDGTLLDHAILVYGAGMGDGNAHAPRDLPIVVMGGGCGQLRSGRLLKAPVDTPMMNLGLTLLDKVGVELESLGDSTGRLADL